MHTPITPSHIKWFRSSIKDPELAGLGRRIGLQPNPWRLPDPGFGGRIERHFGVISAFVPSREPTSWHRCQGVAKGDHLWHVCRPQLLKSPLLVTQARVDRRCAIFWTLSAAGGDWSVKPTLREYAVARVTM
ncbi:unnamed protein product [Protopolystoma xenopodis]|uniref:Uncharacterized protein n=1 Tax=Protopolystoma xenopodis TaxID=117903 RepID=A0A3S5C8T9_9PLAT|nr:unnamed protein product [Protopolystoma xenopodis]